MFKYLHFTLIALFFIAPQGVFAEMNSQTSQTASTVPGFTVTVNDQSEVIAPETLESWKHRSSDLYLSSKEKSEFENSQYCPVNKIFCALTLTQFEKRHLRLAGQTTLDNTKVKAYIADLARKVNKDPQDAKFKVDNGVVGNFAPAQDGLTLDQEKSFDTLSQALLNDSPNVSLPFTTQKATSDYGDINSMGISSLIGEGTSNFKGSPANRIHNLTVAAQRFNGLLIKPGEEFSFVKNLGQVDDTTGYLPELVIKGNQTEPEFGGGICQVSSTAFRAAIYSGLKITARRNHAYPVSYYNPQGMDSTVYIPNPDLKFINNTPGYILIQTKIVGTILTFDFYGTDDGRKTTVDGPYITDKQPDGSMKAHFSQHVVDKNGNVLIDDIFNSSYNSPYLYPHPGAVPLATKPANWSNDQWKAYQQMMKDAAKAAKQ